MQPPVAGGAATDGEFEGGLALSATEDCGPSKQAPPQGHQLAFLDLPQAALQEHAKVIGGDGQVTGCLGRPEATTTKAGDAKLAA